MKDGRFAQPGDDDLDLDIDGITISAVVVEGREVLVGTTGGFGEWIGADGRKSTFLPGEPDEGVEYGDFHLLYPEATETLFAFFVRRLTEWRDQATPLHLCGAPGRMFTLVEDNNKWLPLPRRSHPDWSDEEEPV